MSAFSFILRRRRSAFLGVLALSLVVNIGMTVLTPLFLKTVFDRGVAAKNAPLFLGLMAGFVAIATAWRALNLFLNLRMKTLKQEVFRDLSSEMLAKFYRLPYATAGAFPPAYFASRVGDEPLEASGATIDLALELAAGVASFAAASLLLTRLSARASVLLAVCVPFLILLANKYGAQIKRSAAQEKEEAGRLRGYLTQAAQAYRSVNLFGLSPAASAGLSERLAAFTGVSFQGFKSSSTHNAISAVIMSYAEMLVIIACGFEMMRGRMTFGGYMAFMSAFWTAVGSLRALTQKAPELAKNEIAVLRLREFLDAPESVPAPDDAPGGAYFEGVSFGYGEQTVLDGLTFAIGSSEKILLDGLNGSGKSTVASLLTSFLAPRAGRVRTLPLSRVSAALTPHHFLPGTLADNVGLASLSASKRRYLAELLRDFGLEGALERDPESLSSGQRKKAELVMALLKDAELYVFDEPLANVDAASKGVILDRIFERSRGAALVVVMHGDEAHRARFDRVVELGARAPEPVLYP